MFPTSLPRAQWENVSFSGPSVSDFISDVELAARRTLTIEELAYFNRYYKTSSVIVCETEAEEFDNALNTHIASFPEDQQSSMFAMDSKVREKVGTALISSGMGSLIEYLTPSGRVN